jgi:epoxyqueuosine reductase
MNYERVYGALAKYATGIDALHIIPVPDLSGPVEHTIGALRKGLIPSHYRWTEEKTKRAYSYKGYREWARSVIVAAKYYYTDEEYPDERGYIRSAPAAVPSPGPKIPRELSTTATSLPYGRIARFTWRNNYRYLTGKLREMLVGLEEELGIPIRARALSNYTSIPEKVLFAYSGLGAFGKNCVLINREMGSYFVIGEMLTDLRIDFTGTDFEKGGAPASPDFSLCGNCSLCIDACPTGAIGEQGRLDVNKCYQYLSENLVPLPHAYRYRWGNRLYGCSTCVDVCPYNSELEPSAEKHAVGYVGTGDDLINLLSYSREQWEERFRDNQLIIRDRLAIIQNALLCLGNNPCEEAFPSLLTSLAHTSPIIRSSAAWALGRMDTGESRRALERRLRDEGDASVQDEIGRVL